MEKQGSGAILNIASIAGLRHHVAGRTYVAYSSAKAGMIAFSKATAMAYVKKGIRCNTLVVGTMHTPLVEARVSNRSAAAMLKSLSPTQRGHSDGTHGRRLGCSERRAFPGVR